MGTHPIFESDFGCLTDMTADAVAKTAEEKVKAWGIPSSDFIDDVEKFLSEKFKSEGASDQEIGTDQAEAALRSLDCTEKVMLWLGANVMLEYDATEAQTLLTNNKENAVKSLEDVREQLAFLQDQMTTTEVSMARVYNWDVDRRKAANLK